MENLGEFNLQYSSVIPTALNDVSHDWQGNAADSANSYFTGLAQAISDQQSTLSAMGREFTQTAVGMYETANSIKGLLETLLDLLIAMGIELAAAAASSWTIIGPSCPAPQRP